MLRYINAFDFELTQGRDVGSFLADVFRIQINLPNSIRKHLQESDAIKPALTLAVPIVGATLTLNIGEGQVSGKPAILLDCNVAAPQEIVPEVGPVMETFHHAREVLHGTFMELTEPIHSLMKPEIQQ